MRNCAKRDNLSVNGQRSANDGISLCYWLLILSVIVFAGLIRFRLLDVPLERDEGEYAYAGQLILEGVPPYQEAYNMKWPGIYAVYACILAVFGQTHQAIHAGLLVFNAFTILFVFAIAAHLFKPPVALTSALVFAVLSLSQSLEGVFANSENFVIFFAAAGVLLLLQAARDQSSKKLFTSGILFGLGMITKQHGAAFCVFAFAYVLFDHLLRKPVRWKTLVRQLFALTAGTLLVVAALFCVMLSCGVFKQFWFWTIDYAAAYVSRLPFIVGCECFLSSWFDMLKTAPMLWLLAIIGLIAILAAKELSRSQKLFVFLFSIFSFLSICPGLYFRPHYFVLLLPCMSLLCGAAVYFTSHKIASLFFAGRFSRRIGVAVAAFAIGQPLLYEFDYLFCLPPFEICRSVYTRNPFPESLVIADYIRQNSKPQDTIAIFGSEPQICFYAKRRSASGHIYMYPLMENHEFALRMQQGFIKEIEEKSPDYCVVVNIPASWTETSLSQPLFFEWMTTYIQKNYDLVGLVELFDDHTDYFWSDVKKKPLSSEAYMLICKKNVAQ